MTIIVPASTWQPRARRLADELDADGDLHTPGWRDALLTVPRRTGKLARCAGPHTNRTTLRAPSSGSPGIFRSIWLTDQVAITELRAPDGSWCEITRQPDATGRYPVREAGPTPLWSNIETAWNRWRELGAPA